MELSHRVIVVTGASSGIGRATAVLLGERGAKVVLASRDAGKLRALEAQIAGSLAIPTDMEDFAQIGALFAQAEAKFGRIDGLINNAGRAYESTVERVDPAAFEKIFRLNVLAPVIAIQQVVPALRRAGGGAIVNIGSGTAQMAIPGYSVYSSSKRALVGVSLTARAELASEKISVSMVHPRLTATDFGSNKVRTEADNGIPGGRMGADYSKGDSPEHVAGVIAQALIEGGPEYFAHESMARR